MKEQGDFYKIDSFLAELNATFDRVDYSNRHIVWNHVRICRHAIELNYKVEISDWCLVCERMLYWSHGIPTADRMPALGMKLANANAALLDSTIRLTTGGVCIRTQAIIEDAKNADAELLRVMFGRVNRAAELWIMDLSEAARSYLTWGKADHLRGIVMRIPAGCRHASLVQIGNYRSLGGMSTWPKLAISDNGAEQPALVLGSSPPGDILQMSLRRIGVACAGIMRLLIRWRYETANPDDDEKVFLVQSALMWLCSNYGMNEVPKSFQQILHDRLPARKYCQILDWVEDATEAQKHSSLSFPSREKGVLPWVYEAVNGQWALYVCLSR